MKFFVFGGRKGGKQTEYAAVEQVTREDRERIRELTVRNVEISKLNVELTRQNVELSREVIRLSQRINPVITDEKIEDPPTTSQADLIEARRPEQSQRPAFPGAR